MKGNKMYIEERLAKMEHLISKMQEIIDTLLDGANVPVATTPSKQAEQVADNTITPEEIRQMCVQLVRADPSNKAKVSTILGGKLVKELDPTDYAAIVKKLNALEAK